MISAYRTGFVAGNTASRQHPSLTPGAQIVAAQNEIARRKSLNIAHFYPEEEFIVGFVDGYNAPGTSTDGLTLAASPSEVQISERKINKSA